MFHSPIHQKRRQESKQQEWLQPEHLNNICILPEIVDLQTGSDLIVPNWSFVFCFCSRPISLRKEECGIIR